MTTFLRFPDEARAIACMPGWYADGWQAPEGCAIDVLATLYTPGEYAEDGTELVAPEPMAGWHLNILGDVPAKALPFVVEPTLPRCVFA